MNHQSFQFPLLLLCLFSAPLMASGQRNTPPHHNGLSVNAGLGRITDFTTGHFGLEYERFLDDQGMISVHLPAQLYHGGELTTAEYGIGDTRTDISGVFLAPGIRIHPAGNRGRTDFSFGLAGAFGRFNRSDRVRISGYEERTTDYSQQFGAVLLQANVQLHPARRLFLGAYLQLGPVLTAINPPSVRGSDSILPFLLQLGFRTGISW